MENNTPQNNVTKTFSELVEILAAKLTDKISEDTAKKAITKLKGKLPNLDDVCGLDERICSVRRDIEDQDDRIDSLESDLGDVKSDIEDLCDEDTVREIAQGIVEDELNCQVRGMVKEYLTDNLQITFSFKN
jgi:peptidoglycan hydrolase CwlO-like protein